MDIIAGIVTYNPDINRLQQNVSSIINQVVEIVLVDNGSTNINAIKESFQRLNNIKIVSLKQNKGIAYAHNFICKYAKDAGNEWAIVLDQDSICPPNIISEYSKFVYDSSIGLLCPQIYDVNCGVQMNLDGRPLSEEVQLCISSASAIRLDAWEKIGGLCEDLFIDSVDFDFCMMLREAGYKIVRVNNVVLTHEVGHSKVVRFLGGDRQILNHSALRYYYMYRNAFLVGKRHNCRWLFFKTNLLRFVMINIYEKDRFKKDYYILMGVIHGLIGRFGKY